MVRLYFCLSGSRGRCGLGLVRIIAPCVAIVLLLVSCSARAAVFERDWKTPGDGLLTFDDVNQREWLDLSVSRLSQFPEPRAENAIAQISLGGLFDGFTWAKRDDVRALAESVGIDTSTSNITVNEVPVTQVIEILGPTSQSAFGLRAIGLVDELQTRFPNLPPYDGAAFVINYGGYAGVFLQPPDDLLRPSSNGLMLYRAVPESSNAIRLFMAVYLLFCRRNSFAFHRHRRYCR